MKKVVFDCECATYDQHLTYGSEYELMAEFGDDYIINDDNNVIVRVSKSKFRDSK